MPDPEPDTPRPRSPVERVIDRSYADPSGVGKPLSQRTRQTPRSVEAYLKAGNLPRYMQRLNEIHRETERHRRAVERTYRARRAATTDPERFARDWRAQAQRFDFRELNRLVREHNEWYPIEARLALDPRTRDYVLVSGRPYRREELDADWVLERFPPVLGDAG